MKNNELKELEKDIYRAIKSGINADTREIMINQHKKTMEQLAKRICEIINRQPFKGFIEIDGVTHKLITEKGINAAKAGEKLKNDLLLGNIMQDPPAASNQ